MDELKVKYRYGRRPTRVPKNTLASVIEERNGKPYLFFGIARCHTKLDRFRKTEGRKESLAKLTSARGLYKPYRETSFFLHTDGLRGYCEPQYARVLLGYLNNIEAIMCNKVRDDARRGAKKL